MFLDIEMPVRIQPAQWHPFGPGASNRESHELRDKSTDGDTRLSQTEELIESTAHLYYPVAHQSATLRRGENQYTGRTHNSKEYANGPHANGIYRQAHIVNGRHDGAHLGKWGIVRIVGKDSLGIAIAEEVNFGGVSVLIQWRVLLFVKHLLLTNQSASQPCINSSIPYHPRVQWVKYCPKHPLLGRPWPWTTRELLKEVNQKTGEPTCITYGASG